MSRYGDRDTRPDRDRRDFRDSRPSRDNRERYGDRDRDRDHYRSTRDDTRRRDDDRGDHGRLREDRPYRNDRGPYRNGPQRDYDRGPRNNGYGRPAGGARQQRERSRSPVRPHEPTPDLEDIVPINERKRRQTMWDIKPKGYEAVSAEQAKMSGLFPLPGAPRDKGPVDEDKLKEFVEKGALVLKPPELLPTASRHARRLIVSNLPPLIEDNNLVNLLNDVLYNINLGDGKLTPCVSAHISSERTLAVVEFRSNEETTCALALDGLSFENVKLAFRRPQDYIVPEKDQEDENMMEGGQTSKMVKDSVNKIMIRGLPLELNEESCIELLKSFGDLKAFSLIKDITTDQSKGYAFCEYQDSSVTDLACEELKGMELGDSALLVSRACVGITQTLPEGPGLQAITELVDNSKELDPTNVLALHNLVLPEELNDEQEYQELREDIREECSKFGDVKDIKIPRALGSSRIPPGVGKIYVRFHEPDNCTEALRSLAGRRFADRTVITSYFREENYEVEAF